jgi:hypothetical protein
MREAYARGYAVAGEWEVTLGIETRGGDDVSDIVCIARGMCREALEVFKGSHAHLVHDIERQLHYYYPDRAYFIETEEDCKGIQVYDPKGFIKERCPCRERCGD